MADNKNEQKNGYDVFLERVRQKNRDSEQWRDEQRASFYDRQAMQNKSHDNEEKPTTHGFKQLVVWGALNRDILSNKAEQFFFGTEPTKVEHNHPTFYEDNAGHKHPITRRERHFESTGRSLSWEQNEKEIQLNKKALAILEKDMGGEPAWYKQMLAVPITAIATIVAPSNSEVRGYRNLVERRELADKTNHIENTEKRTDEFYKLRYQNMHLNDGYAGNKAIRNLKPGEKAKGQEGFPFVNEQSESVLVNKLLNSQRTGKPVNPDDLITTPLLRELLNNKKQSSGNDVPSPMLKTPNNTLIQNDLDAVIKAAQRLQDDKPPTEDETQEFIQRINKSYK